MNKIQANSKISRNPDVTYVEIDNEVVMVGPKDSQFYGMNTIGAEIWSMLESQALTFNTICEQVQQHYDVTETTYQDDIMQFLEHMVEQNMLYLTE